MSLKRKASDISKIDPDQDAPVSPLAAAYGFIDLDESNLRQRPPQQESLNQSGCKAHRIPKTSVQVTPTKGSLPSAATKQQVAEVKVIDLESEDEPSGDSEFEVERVLAKRTRKGVLQYLVKWKDWTDENNTWESEENLTSAAEAINEFNEKFRHLARQNKLQKPSSQSSGRKTQTKQVSNARTTVFGNNQPQKSISSPFDAPASLPNAGPPLATVYERNGDPPEVAILKAQVADLKAKLAMKTAQKSDHLQSQIIPRQTGVQTTITAGSHVQYDSIIGHRQPPKKDIEYLVKWRSNDVSSSSWIPEPRLIAAGGRAMIAAYRGNAATSAPQPYPPPTRTAYNPTLAIPMTVVAQELRRNGKQKRIPDDVEQVVDQRYIAGAAEYLVKWKNSDLPSWERRTALVNSGASSLINSYLGKALYQSQNHSQSVTGAYRFLPLPGELTRADSNASPVTDPLIASQQSLVAAMNSATAYLNKDPGATNVSLGGGLWQQHLTTVGRTQNVPPRQSTSKSVLPSQISSNGFANNRVNSGQKDAGLVVPSTQRVGQAKRGRSSKYDIQPNASQISEPLQKRAATHFVDLTVDTKDRNQHTFAASRSKKEEPPRYLLVPQEKKHSGRPLPSGPYSRHTVASNVLIAMGYHPWLPALNIRLKGLMDVDVNTGKQIDASMQHQRGQTFMERLKQKPEPPELPERGGPS